MRNKAAGSGRRRLIFYFSALLLVVLVALLTPLFAARFIGQFLHDEFMRGTGCLVSLSQPQVSFFPVRASIDDVQISCPPDSGKEKETGLTAARVSADLRLSSLLDRRVEITRLDLQEFSVQSENSDSFSRTFNFLFLPNPKHAQSDKQDRWKVVVDTVSFNTPAARSIFRHEENVYALSNVAFYGVRRPLQPDDPFEITLKSDQVEVLRKGQDQALARLSAVEAEIEINDRQILLKELRGKGGQDLRVLLKQAVFAKHEQRDFSLTATLEGNLVEVSELLPALSSMTPYVTSRGKLLLDLKGSLLNEEVDFSTTLESDLGHVLKFGRYCTAGKLGFSGSYKSKSLSFSRLQFGNRVAKGEVLYDLSQGNWGNFSAMLPLVSGDDDAPPLYLCEVDGKALPAWFPESVEFFSEEGGELKLRLNLPGGLTQILALKSDSEKLEANLEGSTRGSIDYSYADGTIGVRGFSVSSVRALAAIDFVRGVLPDGRYAQLASMVAENSLFDLQAEGVLRRSEQGSYSVDFSEMQMSGELSHFLPKYLDAEFEVSFGRRGAEGASAEISLQTAAGLAEGQVTIGVDGVSRWQVEGKALRLGELPILGKVPLRDELFSNLAFSGVEGDRGGISGRIDFYLSGSKGLEESANIDVLSVVVSGSGFAGAAHNQLKIDVVNAKSSLKGSFLLGDQADGKFTVGLDVVDLSYEDIRQVFSRAVISPLSAEDRISAVASYRADFDHPYSGHGEMNVSDLRVASPIGDLDVKEARILANSGRFDIDRFTVATPAGELNVSGNIQSSGALALSLNGDLQMSIAALGPLRSGNARNHLALSLTGDLSNPVVAGRVEVDNGSFALAGSTLLLQFDDIHAALVVDQSKLTIDSLHGHVGGGQFTLNGSIGDMFDVQGSEQQFQLDFHDVSISPVIQSSLEVNGSFVYSAQADDLSRKNLKGEIRIERASYRRDIGLADFLKPVLAFVGVGYGAQVSTADDSGDSLPQDLDIDINLTAEDSLVETNLLSAELFAKLNLLRDSGADDADSELSLHGEMGVADGKFGYKGVLFDILRGNVSFDRAGFAGEPFVDVLGETMLRDAEGDEHFIQLTVYGPLDSYKIKLDSDSGLSEAEISSLMFQNAQGEGISLSREDDLDDLVTLINPFSSYHFTDRIQGFSQFSEVKVTPAFSLETGDITAFIQASRPLWGSLDIVGERDLFTGSSILRFEYPLLPYVNILLGWQSLQRVNQDSSAGSVFTGIDFHYEFFGTSIFPEGFWR